MPIRFIDRVSTIAGRVSSTLANASGAFAGAFVPPPSRTGPIVARLQDVISAITGQFQDKATSTGTIATTLAGHAASFVGDINRQPVWSTVSNFTASAGSFSQTIA